MGATNTTANYNLSQFIGTDKPAWLQDYNGDMLKIDTGINAAKVAADGAQNTADAAQNDATTANNAITNTINPAISSLNTTVGNQGGSINTINSLIGNGTPTTTDQTIIGAINEINASLNGEISDFTPNSGYSKASTAFNGYTKTGNIVTICGRIDITTPSDVVLFTLPSGYRPSGQVNTLGWIAGDFALVTAESNGDVKLRGKSGTLLSNVSVSFCMTFITQ